MELRGEWSEQDKIALREGLAAIRLRVAPTLFENVFDSLVFEVSTSLYWYGFVSEAGDKVSFRCKRGKSYVTPRIVVHELGHVLYIRDRKRLEEELNKGICTVDGVFVTGGTPWGYNRHAGKRAPLNGYWSDKWEDGYQMHPRRWKNGNTAAEDFADMFMNWVFCSFVGNEAGRAQGEWMSGQVERY